MKLNKKIDYNNCYYCGEYVNIDNLDNDMESEAISSEYFDNQYFCNDECLKDAIEIEIKKDYFKLENKNFDYNLECSECQENTYFVYYLKNKKYNQNYLECIYCLYKKMY